MQNEKEVQSGPAKSVHQWGSIKHLQKKKSIQITMRKKEEEEEEEEEEEDK